jgi:hypothetical protein
MINEIIVIVILYDAVFQESITIIGKDATKVNKTAEDRFITEIKKESPEYADHMKEAILDDGFFCNNAGWEFFLTHPEVVES